MTFYDAHGRPIAYLIDDSEHIYLFSGEPVAYLSDNTVYGFNGHQFGWFEDGWVRDLHGYSVFFTEESSGFGPAKPARGAVPAKGARHARPAKSARYAKQAKAANSLVWSSLSGTQFFRQ